MNNLVAGIGDVLLRYPELIESLDAIDNKSLDWITRTPYVAVHLDASSPEKIPPNPHLLLLNLIEADVHFVAIMPGSKLRKQIEIVKRASKFIGTLSCFNVVAQLAKVPSFVLVNASIKEPFIYGLMTQNGARVEEWNIGKPVKQIYAEAVEWAKS